MLRYAPIMIFAASFLCFFGCSNSGRQSVSGKVTFKGQPLDKGEITFTNDENQAFGKIANGEFSIPSDRGPKPGSYIVRISSLDEGKAKEEPVPGVPFEAKDRIPPEFNTKSTKRVEVTADGTNTFEFKIP